MRSYDDEKVKQYDTLKQSRAVQLPRRGLGKIGSQARFYEEWLINAIFHSKRKMSWEDRGT